MVKAKKPVVGIYGITGCMGCQLQIVYQNELLTILDAIDLRSFPVGKEKNDDKCKFDIIFLEGVVVSKEDLKMLKKLRKRTKVLVAMGACATDGCVPAIKNFVDADGAQKVVYGNMTKHLKIVDPTPIDKHVKVDYYVRGCPADKMELLQLFKAVLTGKKFRPEERPICHACNLQNNGCLLEKGKECLGPVTFGNCSVMCPHFAHPCIGCRGPLPDANFEAYFEMMEKKGYSREHIMQRMNKYAGLRFKEYITKELAGDKEEHNEEHDCCFDMFCHFGEKKN
jgi:sulfhydrogenase subunit delta